LALVGVGFKDEKGKGEIRKRNGKEADLSRQILDPALPVIASNNNWNKIDILNKKRKNR